MKRPREMTCSGSESEPDWTARRSPASIVSLHTVEDDTPETYAKLPGCTTRAAAAGPGTRPAAQRQAPNPGVRRSRPVGTGHGGPAAELLAMFRVVGVGLHRDRFTGRMGRLCSLALAPATTYSTP